MYCSNCSGNSCRNEVLQGLYSKCCDKFIGKRSFKRECMSREGLGVFERYCRWDFISTNGQHIGNRIEDGKRMGEKRK